ncbi:hypothetical protein U6J50_12185, partial [Cutibacterium acnes]
MSSFDTSFDLPRAVRGASDDPRRKPAIILPRLAAGLRRLAAFGRRSALVLALLALWEAAPRLGLTDPAFLPPL